MELIYICILIIVNSKLIMKTVYIQVKVDLLKVSAYTGPSIARL